MFIAYHPFIDISFKIRYSTQSLVLYHLPVIVYSFQGIRCNVVITIHNEEQLAFCSPYSIIESRRLPSILLIEIPDWEISPLSAGEG